MIHDLAGRRIFGGASRIFRLNDFAIPHCPRRHWRDLGDPMGKCEPASSRALHPIG